MRTSLSHLVVFMACGAVAACGSSGNSGSTGTTSSTSSGATTGAGGPAAGGAGGTSGGHGGAGGATGQGGAGGQAGGGHGGQGGAQAASIDVTPKDPTVLTCSKTTFVATVTGLADASVDWTASAGSIDDKGVFSAPITQGPAVSVKATSKAQPSLAASSTVTLATALPQAKVVVAQTPGYADVYPHAMASAGKRVYAAYPAQSFKPSPTVDVLRSDDGGKTWSAPVHASPTMVDGTEVSCVAVAVDAGNPDVVYVVFNFGAGSGLPPKLVDAGIADDGGVALLVSTDGGKTFGKAYPLQTGNSSDSIPVAQGICPDVASPKAGAVVVETPGGSNDQSLFVWSDANQGSGFSALTFDEFNSIAKAETGALAKIDADVGQNGGSADATESPRLFTDGAGNLCIAYIAYTPKGSGSPDSSAWVQCSTDLGKTFSAPVTVGPTFHYVGDGQVSLATGAFGPNGAIAVAWNRLGANDPQNRAASLHVAHSKDLGKTFVDVIVPLVVDPSLPDGVTMAAGASDVRFDADGVLWVAYEGNDGRIAVDKSCDGGTTWSGGVLVDMAGGTLDAARLPGLVPTDAGMALSAAASDATEARLYRLVP
jgi:hypothetical protein